MSDTPTYDQLSALCAQMAATMKPNACIECAGGVLALKWRLTNHPI